MSSFLEVNGHWLALFLFRLSPKLCWRLTGYAVSVIPGTPWTAIRIYRRAECVWHTEMQG